MPRKARIRPYMGQRRVGSSRGPVFASLQASFRENVGGIIKSLEEYLEDFKDITPDVLVEALEPTFGKALEYTPEDTGDLRESGYLEAEKFHNRSVVAIGFT